MRRRRVEWDPEQMWLPFGDLPEIMRKMMLRREMEKRRGAGRGEEGVERELRLLSLTPLLLAGDLVSCGMQPPLLPTQEAILRTLYVVGEAGTGVLLRVVPCNEATIFQQLKRLVDAGLVDKRVERWRNGRRVKVYRLSGGGRRMVAAWTKEAEKKLEYVRRIMKDDLRKERR